MLYWKRITTVLLDVDGVLTSGALPYRSSDSSGKDFHARDGAMIKTALAAGIQVGIISGRASRLVEDRCRELGMDPCFTGMTDKVAAIGAWCLECGRDWREIAYLGDDLPDLALFERVAVAGTVADAPSYIKRRVDWVARTAGGRGAVAECLLQLLRAQGRWASAREAARSHHG